MISIENCEINITVLKCGWIKVYTEGVGIRDLFNEESRLEKENQKSRQNKIS